MFILVAGAPGTGKTFFIKSMLRKWQIPESKIWAVDINDEYDTDFKFYDHEFLIEVSQSAKNKVIVFEEATSFFAHNNKREVKRFFTTHRHTGHTIFANFHSLSSIPADLLMAVDFFYFTETIEKRPPAYLSGLKPYTLYSADEIKEIQAGMWE